MKTLKIEAKPNETHEELVERADKKAQELRQQGKAILMVEITDDDDAEIMYFD